MQSSPGFLTSGQQKTGGGDSHNKTKRVLYVADSGKNTCRECSDNDGKIFDIDDPGLPQLPIHPHCRCKYVSVAEPYEDVGEGSSTVCDTNELKSSRHSKTRVKITCRNGNGGRFRRPLDPSRAERRPRDILSYF